MDKKEHIEHAEHADREEQAPAVIDAPTEGEVLETEPEPQKSETVMPKDTNQVIEETGVISEKTKVTGDISTNGHLVIYGEVEGNITALGNVNVTGKIDGDISCNNLKLSGCAIKSNITANESVIVEESADIKGMILCQNLSIDGTIHGDIDAGAEVKVYKNARITGNIKAKSLGIEAGAELQGNIMVVS